LQQIFFARHPFKKTDVGRFQFTAIAGTRVSTGHFSLLVSSEKKISSETFFFQINFVSSEKKSFI